MDKLVTMPCSQEEYDELANEWLDTQMCARCGIAEPYKDYEWCLSCRPELEIDV